MRILVQTISKENTEVDVTGNTVGHLRTEIVKSKNIPENKELKIIFNGKILENDSDTFEQVGITQTLNKVVILVKNKPVAAPVPTSQPVSTPASAPAPTTVAAPAPKPVVAQPPTQAQAPTSSQPVNLFDLAAQAQQQQQQVGGEGLPNMDGNLDGIPEMGPEAAMFQQLLMSNPQMITQLLMSSPEFQQNPQALEQLLANPEFLQQIATSLVQNLSGAGDLGDGQNGGTIPIMLTAEEIAQVEQLEALGIDRQTAIYYYESCGRNVDLAAEMIFQDLNAGDAQEEEYYEEGTDQSQ